MWAIISGHKIIARLLILSHKKLSKIQNEIIYVCMKNEYINMYIYIFEILKINPTNQDFLNNSLIHASNFGHLIKVKFLSKYNFNEFIRRQALTWPVIFGYLDIIELLFCPDDYHWVLDKAIQCGNLHTIKYLTKNGTNIKIDKDTLSNLPIFGHLNIIKFFADNGCLKNINKDRMLYIAEQYERTDIYEYLVANI